MRDILLAMTSFTNGSRADGSWMIFSDVDERAFEDISNSENAILPICSKIFNPTGNLLILKMESLSHSTTSMAITRWIHRTAHAMNVESEIIITATVLNKDVQPSVSEGNSSIIQKKKADQTIYPLTCAPSRTMKWPSFVLEVAYTEMRYQVEQDMRLWLQATEGRVKFAMSASVRPQSKRITLEQWELRPMKDRPDQGIAEPTQVMWIEKPQHSHHEPTIGERFEIPFKSLFLRDRQRTEVDMVMTREDLSRLARDVWRVDMILTAQNQ
jgi:hypothetical protein